MGMKGRCQCGQVSFETPLDKPLRINICHCTECQHQSSSGFGVTAVFPYSELLASVSNLVGSYTRHTITGRDMECLFCKNCGARMLHRFRNLMLAPGENSGPTAISRVKGGFLDLDKQTMSTAVHIWCQLAFVPIPRSSGAQRRLSRIRR